MAVDQDIDLSIGRYFERHRRIPTQPNRVFQNPAGAMISLIAPLSNGLKMLSLFVELLI